MFNFVDEFQKVFTELDDIETDLIKNNAKNDEIKDKLLNLRKEIDQCIGYWLHFEERLGTLQEKYGIDIPDQLDESLMSAYLSFTENDTVDLKMFNTSHDEEPSKLSSKEYYRTKSISVTNFRKGLGYFNLDMLEEAKREFEKVINLNPDLTMAHYFLGLAYYFRNEYEQALKKFRLLLELIEDQELIGVLCNAIGNIYIDKKEQSRALKYFLRASEYVKSPDILFNCGAVYFNVGEYYNSLNYFLEAIKTSEDSDSDWELHLYTGKVFAYLNKLDKALHHLQIASNLYPNNCEIHFELGLVYHLRNNEQQALQEYALARRISQNNER